jgi:hypothetical protein
MKDNNESEWETYSFFERFVHDDEFRELIEVTYGVPVNSDSDSDSDSDSNKINKEK